MGYTPGTIIEGTVKTITGFGAFVLLPEGQTGLVHISEVAPTFVNDIRQHLTEGQTVKVKVLSVGENGKLSLSIKQAVPREPAARPFRPRAPRQEFREPSPRTEPESFEEKL